MRIRHLWARSRIAAITALAAAVLVGCGAPTSPDSLLPNGFGGSTTRTSSPPGPFGTFVAVTALGHELVDGVQVVFEFSLDGVSVRASVRTGCNTMTGRVRVEGTRLVFDDLARTEMGCEQALMAQEDWLASLLGSSPEFDMGDYLTLTGRGVVPQSLTLQARKLGAPVPIEFTYWKLTSLIDGDTASSVPAGVKGRMHMARGQIWFTAGCNGYRGTVSIEPTSGAAGSLVITEVTATAKGCLDATAPVELTMEDVLRGRVPITLSPENRLTVGTPGGAQLEFMPV